MLKSFMISVVLLGLSALVLAAEPPVYTGLIASTGAGGYDVVSYFNNSSATKGSETYTADYKGATWRFANAENKAAFEADPERYFPAYGGYCAWAVSQGYLAKGDPRHWTVRNGRLYLNYDKSIKDRWLTDTENFIRLANANWPAVLEK